MKTLLCVLICSGALAGVALAQTPAPMQSPAAALTPSATVSPATSASPGGDLADKIHERFEKKFKGRHGIVIDGDDHDGSDEIPSAIIPILTISLLAVFGTPILIVATIMYFGFSKSRMQHRTIKMLVEKGQPVPPELLRPPAPAVRQRSDMRRGVILVMIGIGVMLFFAAVNDWEGGSWTLGLIPFLIGAGYLIVWKLEGGVKRTPDNPPPLP